MATAITEQVELDLPLPLLHGTTQSERVTARHMLWLWVRNSLDIAIPDTKCCDHHCTPFMAFADAFFGETVTGDRVNVAVWKASRGLGGKTHLLATLSRTEAELLGASSSVLGGSRVQSDRVLEYVSQFFRGREHLLVRDVASETELRNGARLTALTASTRSVRGAHPQRLRLDEIDEMDMTVLRSALGQPMEQPGLHGVPIPPQTVCSSTHQYADGPMSWAIGETETRIGWRFYEWCYRENSIHVGGWLSDRQVEDTRATMPIAQWEAEVLGQEPNPEARAIADVGISHLFDRSRGEYHLASGYDLEIEPPEHGAQYTTGADWARKQDETWIWTIRHDCVPARVVAVRYGNRLPWPVMIDWLNARLDRYPGLAGHDALGVGDVVSGYLRHNVKDVLAVGRTRSDMLSQYIGALERGEIVGPVIHPAYRRYRYASHDDIYSTAQAHHCPDEVMAGAIAWYAQSAGSVSFSRRTF